MGTRGPLASHGFPILDIRPQQLLWLLRSLLLRVMPHSVRAVGNPYEGPVQWRPEPASSELPVTRPEQAQWRSGAVGKHWATRREQSLQRPASKSQHSRLYARADWLPCC